MKYITKSIKIHSLLAVLAVMFILASCNKDLEQIQSPAAPAPSGLALGESIAAIPDDSLYYKMILRGGMLTTLNNKTATFTLFVPNNQAVRNFISGLSGGVIPPNAPDPTFVAFINTNIPVATAAAIVSYNMIPQAIKMSSVPSTFPNWYYPTNVNPTGAPGGPGYNAFARLTTHPARRNGNWVNNVPLSAVDAVAYNGIIHTASLMVPTPPSRFLWNRISADADMDYFEAAVLRADSGVAPTTSASLQWVLSNFGPNVNVFVPTDAAFEALIYGLVYQQVFAATGNAVLAAAAAAGAVAAGPAFLSTNNVSTQLVKGIVVYHMMGARAFTNNFPTTATAYPTLLNTAIAAHPGVTLTATFTGPLVSAATVKGLGNATASNIILNTVPFTPDPNGTSDQHFVNGTLHKINQVLLPQ
jgi:Fasciclin domain